jgi:uncharacterized protein
VVEVNFNINVINMNFRLFFKVLTASFLAFFVVALWMETPLVQDTLLIKTENDSHPFTIEISQSHAQKAKGLMGRTSIAVDSGMLFMWPEDQPVQMWMKDTPLSLDMLFLNANGKIVFIQEQTTPNSTANIDPGMPVRAVLEIAGGISAQKGIKTGHTVIHALFKK